MFSLSVNDWLVSRKHTDQGKITSLQNRGIDAAVVASDKTLPPIDRLDAAGVAMKNGSAIMLERLWSYARILNDAVCLMAVSEHGFGAELGCQLFYNILTLPLSDEEGPNWAPLERSFSLADESHRRSLHKSCSELLDKLSAGENNGGGQFENDIAGQVDRIVAALKQACTPWCH